MSNFAALLRRELGVYFVSPLAYIVLTVFLLITGYVYQGWMDYFAGARLPFSFQPVFSFISILTFFMVPVVTMRLLAEEKSRGTMEMLMTAPVTEWQVVLAKYAAAVFLFLYLLLPTIALVLLAGRYADLDYGPILSGYFGLLLISLSLLSIGLFISSLCQSQVSAGVVTLVVTFFLLMSDWAVSKLPAGNVWYELLTQISLGSNLMKFLEGVIDTQNIVYYLGVIVFFLFLTVRAVESRRWK